jgi:Endoribonuclease L-PSP
MSNSPHLSLFSPEALFAPTVGYSQVAEVGSGKLVYIAGQVPFDKAGQLIGKDDFLVQAAQVFENLKAASKRREVASATSSSRGDRWAGAARGRCKKTDGLGDSR